jgi:hypothetical protein
LRHADPVAGTLRDHVLMTRSCHHGGNEREHDRTVNVPIRAISALAVTVVLAACSSRPAGPAWEQSWTAASASVRDVTGSVDPGPPRIDQAVCPEFVSIAQRSRTELIPAPTAEIEGQVRAWADLVEAVGVECASAPDPTSLLTDLADLTNTVDAMLQAELPSR